MKFVSTLLAIVACLAVPAQASNSALPSYGVTDWTDDLVIPAPTNSTALIMYCAPTAQFAATLGNDAVSVDNADGSVLLMESGTAYSATKTGTHLEHVDAASGSFTLPTLSAWLKGLERHAAKCIASAVYETEYVNFVPGDNTYIDTMTIGQIGFASTADALVSTPAADPQPIAVSHLATTVGSPKVSVDIPLTIGSFSAQFVLYDPVAVADPCAAASVPANKVLKSTVQPLTQSGEIDAEFDRTELKEFMEAYSTLAALQSDVAVATCAQTGPDTITGKSNGIQLHGASVLQWLQDYNDHATLGVLSSASGVRNLVRYNTSVEIQDLTAASGPVADQSCTVYQGVDQNTNGTYQGMQYEQDAYDLLVAADTLVVLQQKYVCTVDTQEVVLYTPAMQPFTIYVALNTPAMVLSAADTNAVGVGDADDLESATAKADAFTVNFFRVPDRQFEIEIVLDEADHYPQSKICVRTSTNFATHADVDLCGSGGCAVEAWSAGLPAGVTVQSHTANQVKLDVAQTGSKSFDLAWAVCRTDSVPAGTISEIRGQTGRYSLGAASNPISTDTPIELAYQCDERSGKRVFDVAADPSARRDCIDQVLPASGNTLKHSAIIAKAPQVEVIRVNVVNDNGAAPGTVLTCTPAGDLPAALSDENIGLIVTSTSSADDSDLMVQLTVGGATHTTALTAPTTGASGTEYCKDSAGTMYAFYDIQSAVYVNAVVYRDDAAKDTARTVAGPYALADKAFISDLIPNGGYQGELHPLASECIDSTSDLSITERNAKVAQSAETQAVALELQAYISEQGDDIQNFMFRATAAIDDVSQIDQYECNTLLGSQQSTGTDNVRAAKMSVMQYFSSHQEVETVMMWNSGSEYVYQQCAGALTAAQISQNTAGSSAYQSSLTPELATSFIKPTTSTYSEVSVFAKSSEAQFSGWYSSDEFVRYDPFKAVTVDGDMMPVAPLEGTTLDTTSIAAGRKLTAAKLYTAVADIAAVACADKQTGVYHTSSLLNKVKTSDKQRIDSTGIVNLEAGNLCPIEYHEMIRTQIALVTPDTKKLGLDAASVEYHGETTVVKSISNTHAELNCPATFETVPDHDNGRVQVCTMDTKGKYKQRLGNCYDSESGAWTRDALGRDDSANEKTATACEDDSSLVKVKLFTYDMTSGAVGFVIWYNDAKHHASKLTPKFESINGVPDAGTTQTVAAVTGTIAGAVLHVDHGSLDLKTAGADKSLGAVVHFGLQLDQSTVLGEALPQTERCASDLRVLKTDSTCVEQEGLMVWDLRYAVLVDMMTLMATQDGTVEALTYFGHNGDYFARGGNPISDSETAIVHSAVGTTSHVHYHPHADLVGVKLNDRLSQSSVITSISFMYGIDAVAACGHAQGNQLILPVPEYCQPRAAYCMPRPKKVSTIEWDFSTSTVLSSTTDLAAQYFQPSITVSQPRMLNTRRDDLTRSGETCFVAAYDTYAQPIAGGVASGMPCSVADPQGKSSGAFLVFEFVVESTPNPDTKDNIIASLVDDMTISIEVRDTDSPTDNDFKTCTARTFTQLGGTSAPLASELKCTASDTVSAASVASRNLCPQTRAQGDVGDTSSCLSKTRQTMQFALQYTGNDASCRDIEGKYLSNIKIVDATLRHTVSDDKVLTREHCNNGTQIVPRTQDNVHSLIAGSESFPAQTYYTRASYIPLPPSTIKVQTHSDSAPKTEVTQTYDTFEITNYVDLFIVSPRLIVNTDSTTSVAMAIDSPKVNSLYAHLATSSKYSQAANHDHYPKYSTLPCDADQTATFGLKGAQCHCPMPSRTATSSYDPQRGHRKAKSLYGSESISTKDTMIDMADLLLPSGAYTAVTGVTGGTGVSSASDIPDGIVLNTDFITMQVDVEVKETVDIPTNPQVEMALAYACISQASDGIQGANSATVTTLAAPDPAAPGTCTPLCTRPDDHLVYLNFGSKKTLEEYILGIYTLQSETSTELSGAKRCMPACTADKILKEGGTGSVHDFSGFIEKRSEGVHHADGTCSAAPARASFNPVTEQAVSNHQIHRNTLCSQVPANSSLYAAELSNADSQVAVDTYTPNSDDQIRTLRTGTPSDKAGYFGIEHWSTDKVFTYTSTLMLDGTLLAGMGSKIELNQLLVVSAVDKATGRRSGKVLKQTQTEVIQIDDNRRSGDASNDNMAYGVSGMFGIGCANGDAGISNGTCVQPTSVCSTMTFSSHHDTGAIKATCEAEMSDSSDNSVRDTIIFVLIIVVCCISLAILASMVCGLYFLGNEEGKAKFANMLLKSSAFKGVPEPADEPTTKAAGDTVIDL